MTEGSAELWAKTTPEGQPGISVRDHCLNVGCLAEALIGALRRSVKDLLPQGPTPAPWMHIITLCSPPAWEWSGPEAGDRGQGGVLPIRDE